MKTRTSRSAVAAALIVGLFAVAPQARAESPALTPPLATTPEAGTTAVAPPGSALLGDAMQRAIAVELRRADASLATSPPTQQPDDEPERKRGIGRAILGAATGAVAGFFAGAFLGASLEPDCNCDDPGLRGVLIGAPIGAVAGGIVGAKWFF